MSVITLEERVTALERQNRRLRSWTGALTALLMVPVFAAATGGQSDVVRASRFEVVRQGQVVVQIDGDVDGGQVVIRNAAGVQAGFLQATATGGSLDISNAQGKTAGFFDAMKDGSGKVCVYNAEGKCITAIYSVDNGGMIEVIDRTSVKAATLSAGLIGGGNLTIFDSQGRRAAYLKAGAWGGSLDISKRGETVAYFDAASADTPGGAILCVGKTASDCMNRIPR